jgi:coenzyme PQQ biosynthesis protein PqqD
VSDGGASPTVGHGGRRPRLAPRARLRFDRRDGRWVLLYPETGLVLNPTAAAILRLCTGEHTVDAIVERLAGEYAGQPRDAIAGDVTRLLDTLAGRGLVQDDP